jgi:hypothetical protein
MNPIMATAAARSPAARILLGPGPSTVHPRVLQALSTPLVGHLDPVFLRLMDETKELLRFVFQTQNPLTLPNPGQSGELPGEGSHGRGCGHWGKALPLWRSWAEGTGTSERGPLQKRRWSG